MSRHINADKLITILESKIHTRRSTIEIVKLIDALKDNAIVDAIEIVKCKDCIYYHKAHVKCPDGTDKDESEFPDEAFGVLGRIPGLGVTMSYGINVGGQCEYEKDRGYIEDKSVFRSPNDYCSRGMRKEGGE